MKIWHISDTHCFHWGVSRFNKIPADVDLIIHSGDACSSSHLEHNRIEWVDFLIWFKGINNIPKIFVPGNHDCWIEKNEKIARSQCYESGIKILINEPFEFLGLNFWGSPLTPWFNDWAYNRRRESLNKMWQTIPDNTDVIICHGPPKGVLDITEDKDRKVEQVGCSALGKRIEKIKPKAVLFGHIHDYKDYKNTGVLYRDDIIYSNASCIEDGKDKLKFFGNILNL